MSCPTHSSQARWSGMCAGTLWHSINRFRSSSLSSRQQQDNRGVPPFFWGGDLKISRWPFSPLISVLSEFAAWRMHGGIILKIPPLLSAEVRSLEPEGNSSLLSFLPYVKDTLLSDVASDRRPNIIPECMDTFAFGSGPSAAVQANPQLETVGKVTFFFLNLEKQFQFSAKISTGVQRWWTSKFSSSGRRHVIAGGFPNMK